MQSAIPMKLRLSETDAPYLESLLQSWPSRIVVVVAATVFIAICAHISLPLPFTPVPLTTSDFAVLLVGMLLGPVAGFSALVLYLAEGAMGLPVFSPHGLGGVAQLMGPTAGYLFAYPFAAAVAGLASTLARKNISRFAAALLAGSVATAIILSSGAAWLGHWHSLGFAATWSMAIAPFLFGAAAKVVAASGIFSSTRRWARS